MADNTKSGTVTRFGFTHSLGETHGYYILRFEEDPFTIRFRLGSPQADIEALALTLPGDQITITFKDKTQHGWCDVLRFKNHNLN